jgi:hypothetical protein
VKRLVVVVEEEADAVGRLDRLYLETLTHKAEEVIRSGGIVAFEHHPVEEEPILSRNSALMRRSSVGGEIGSNV